MIYLGGREARCFLSPFCFVVRLEIRRQDLINGSILVKNVLP